MMSRDRQLQVAYTASTVFLAAAVILGLLSVFLWYQYDTAVTQLGKAARNESVSSDQSFLFSFGSERNIVQEAYPHLDFSRFYPGLDGGDIDLLQRESFGIRYVYSPFVQFEPLPQQGKFVNISTDGFRNGIGSTPWPPIAENLSIFVFGGSTTLGYGVPDDSTVVSQIARRLAADFSGSQIDVYNFGRGYYFSAQEREQFWSLLKQGIVPDIAVFIDGLNDFYYVDGRPELTEQLFSFIAPDLRYERLSQPVSDADRAAAVDRILERYEHHVWLVQAMADRFEVDLLFVGQPVPFLDYPGSLTVNYPFSVKGVDGHYLAAWGYDRFERAAREGRFGKNFVWAGDAFAGQSGPMYVDLVHYSQEGNARLAETIVERGLRDRVLSRLTGAATQGAPRSSTE
jgi:hypothetical protein